MGSIGKTSKFSKKNKLLLVILICSIAVVFSFLAVLVYINYYARVNVILTTITWYEDGGVKNVTEFDIVTLKKGRSVNSLPKPSVEGYMFGGWYFDKGCQEPFDYSKELHESIQIYGKLNLLEYSIELVLDDTTKISTNTSRECDYNEKLTIEDIIKLPRAIDAVTLQDGTETTIADYKIAHREGYTFEGWGFSASAYNTVAFDYRMVAQNLTFYAIWKPIQVELQYWTPILSFANDSPQTGEVQRRINQANGGLDYTGRRDIYMSETVEYATKVTMVAEPVDEYKNFEFAGWYLDPEFTVPLKFAQLYARNGYFSLTKEHNKNILQDELYFDDGHTLDDAQLANVAQYSSRDEHNSYIKIFAKWTLKKYTIRYHLNLPDAEAYVKTDNMRSIVYEDVPLEVFFDNANNLIEKQIFQGQDMTGSAGVLYADSYFSNVVYIKNDLTGQPLYTFKSWNSQKDGMGYDLSNNYFDKSHFNIDADEIVIYAQWRSYYRVNYYLTDATDQFGVASANNILLGTVNVTDDVIRMPELGPMVADLTDRRITFNEDQKRMNQANVDMRITYYTPLNKTFIGWSNDTTYSQSSPLYLNNVTYSVGTDVSRNAGIALNAPVRNLYTTWINNVNVYRYDLGVDGIEKADFNKNAMSQNIRSAIITKVNGADSYLEYVYETTNTYSTIQTIYNEEFLITKEDGADLYSLNGWRLADGTKIDGKLSQEIKFNRAPLYVKYINNSIEDTTKYRDIETGVYFEGNRVIDRAEYYTRYDSNEDRSYIVLRARNYTMLIFEAVWVKNITLTYNPGVDDVVWASGTSAETLTNLAGGSVYMQFTNPNGIMARPYYKFYGWSTVNREGSEVVRFDEFVENTEIYYPDTRYYDLFEVDTELFAVWQPVVYTIHTYTQVYNSLVNSSSGKFLIAKEKFVYNGNSVTDMVVLNKNSVTAISVSGETIITALTTSALPGYGLSSWTNDEGVDLQKIDNKYTILVGDDVNGLFEQYPETNYNNINIYPTYSITTYTVTILLYGDDVDNDGIKESEVELDIPGMKKICTDITYGTNLKTLLPPIYTAYFDNGHQFKGWNIKGDIDYSGQEKEDYILGAKTIASSNILVKSDLTITLVADKLKYTIKFVYNNPNGDAAKIVNYELYHGDSLGELQEEIENELALRDYVGYNFKHWQATAGPMTTYLTQENLASVRVTSPMDLNSKYERADVKVIFNYTHDSDDCVEEKESEFLTNVSLVTSTFAQQPKKDGYLLKGWAVSEDDGAKYFDADSILNLTVSEVGDYLVRPVGENYFVLNLYAKWVEKVVLTFDIDDVIISYPNFPAEIVYEKGQKLYFTDIPHITELTNTSIKQNSGLGEYVGIWEDNMGNSYRVTLSNSFILMDRDLTITPKFNPKTFYVTYNYSYGGRYYTLDALTISTNEQYVTAPTLATKDQLDAEIAKHPELADYRSVELYLSRSKYESEDVNYKFDLGANFDFINNVNYINTVVNGNTFEFYVKLKELQPLTYYYDRDENAIQATLKFETDAPHIIGDTDNDGSVDYIPTKLGYEFAGWTTSLALNYVLYNNGDSIAPGTTYYLYPVWHSKEVNIIYCNIDGSEIAHDDGRLFTDSITLPNIPEPGKQLSGWKTTVDGAVEFIPGSTLLLEDVREDFAVQNGSVFEIYLYADWQIAMYSISFKSYNDDGTSTTLYGNKLGSISASEFVTEYDDVTIVNYEFPATTETYVIAGQKYRFTHRWKCGANYYSTLTTGDLKFVQSFEFEPLYEKVHTLTFKYDTNVTIYEIEVVDGDTYYFNDVNLLTATSEYNTDTLIPNGNKIVAYTYSGNTYDSTKFIQVGQSVEFTAKVVDLVSVVIYKDLQFDGYNFTFVNESNMNNIELSTSINLADTGYQTTLGNCDTVGFVVSTSSTYTYDPDASKVMGNFSLSTSGAVKGSTIYFYPIIKTTVLYFVNGVQSDSEEVLFGKTLTKSEIMEEEGQYYTNWKVGSQSGSEYDGSVVHGYLELYTVGKPFLQLKVSSLDNFIDNASTLTIRKLRPSDVFELPIASQVTLKEITKYTLGGWYISYEGQFVMDGSNRKEYSLGQLISLQSVINDLGKNIDEISQVSFDMHPVINYNLKTLTLTESANVTYSFVVNLQCDTSGLGSTEIDDLKNAFIINNSGYEFKLLNASAITVISASDSIRFTAYLVNAGKVVNTNNQPTTAIITVSKNVATGYSSSGWIYTGTNTVVVSGDRLYENKGIQAQIVQADNITLAVNLQFFNGVNNITIDELNIDDYDEYFYMNTSNRYGYSVNTTYGSIITFSVVVYDGYEIYAFVDAGGNPVTQNVSVNGNIRTFTHQVSGATQLYVVVRKELEFKPIISIDSGAITDYDENKIESTSSMYIEYRENVAGSSWTKLYKSGSYYELNWNEFKSGYQYSSVVGIDDLIKVYTNFTSKYYYVKQINVYNDESLNNTHGGTNSVVNNSTSTEISVTGILRVELVLAERTYSINYYDGSGALVSDATNVVSNLIEINLPSVSKEGYELQGFKVLAGSKVDDVEFVDYLIADGEYSLEQLQKNISNRNEANQNAYVLLMPVWTKALKEISITSNDGYFIVNEVSVEEVSETIPYGGVVTFVKTEDSGTIVDNELSFITESYAIDANGNVVETSASVSIVFVPYGTLKFVEGYIDNATNNIFASMSITEDLSLLPKVESGSGAIIITIDDESFDCNNKNLLIGNMKFIKNTDELEQSISYDSNGSLIAVSCAFDSQDNCTIEIDLTSAFAMDSIDVVIDGYRLSNYASIEDFKDAVKLLNIEIISNRIIFADLIYNVEIICEISRNSFETCIQVENDSALADIFEEISNNGDMIASIDGVELTQSSVSLGSQETRKEVTYVVAYNLNYFDIDSIYYVDNGTTYIVFGSGSTTCLSSFNPITNELKVVYGGEAGNNITFYIKLKLRTFNVILHAGNGTIYSSSDDYSVYLTGLTPSDIELKQAYEYGSTFIINASDLFTPNNIVVNGVNYEFGYWRYYDGNYENDSPLDNNKIKDLNTLNWTFNAENGNLHILAYCNKLFNVNFEEVNDGIDADQTNFPLDLVDVSLSDALVLTIAERSGFTFGGYAFVYDGNRYYLRYNGASFVALQDGSGNVVTTTETFDENNITLSMIVTSTMINALGFNTISFEPIWERNGLTLDINYNSSQGSVETYKYVSGTYEIGTFDVKYYYTLQAGIINVDGANYNCLYVKDGANSVGVIVAKPITSNFYKFGEFQIEGVVIGTHILDEACEIDVIFAVDYVPHTMNVAWDKAYSDVTYTVTNTGTHHMKLEAYNNNVLEVTEMRLEPGVTITFDRTYSKFKVYALRNDPVSGVINLYGYYNVENDSSNIELTLPGLFNMMSTTTNFTVKLNRLTVNLDQYMANDLENVSTEGGAYRVGYYAPIIDTTSGLITDYDIALTYVNVTSGSAQLVDIVSGTDLYVEQVADCYEVVALFNGNSNVTNVDNVINCMYTTLPDSGIYDIKVVFDNEYSLVNFKINNKVYASAYFKTTTGNTANDQLVAFANVVVNGYSNSGAYINSLFDGATGLVYKTKGYNKESYTETELMSLFNFDINKNIATTYYNVAEWQNIWVDEFDFGVAYQPLTGITINNLYIGAGVLEVTFVATISDALVLNMAANLIAADNGAAPQGSFKLEGDAYTNNYVVLGSSQVGYNGNYSTLNIKVKDNTNLPKLTIDKDVNTQTSNATIVFSEMKFSSTDNAGLLAIDGRYDYVHDFEVKHFKIALSTSDNNGLTNWHFEQDYSNPDNPRYFIMNFNYCSSFDDIISEYGLQNSYTEDVEYVYNGIYHEGNRIDQNSVDDFLAGLLYNNASLVYLVVRYEAQP